MRKLFAPLILSLFFFIPFRVNGATINVTINPLDYSFFTDENFSSNYNFLTSKSNYYLVSHGSSNSYTLYTYDSFLELFCYGGACQSERLTVDAIGYPFTFPPLTFDENTFYSYHTIYSSNVNKILFTNFSLSPVGITFILSDGTYTYTCDPNAGCSSIPSVLDFYKMFYEDPIIDPTPPEPEDNTPLLTTFYSVVIDKIGEICTFFTSNYLYLSVFVIFLFYISILLLRRFIK